MKTNKTTLRWIVPALDPYTTPELPQVHGCQVYGGAALGEDYSGDIAGLISSEPIDHLAEIIVDGQKVWPDSGPGLYRSGQPNPVRLAIKHYYTAWLYWGTAEQTADDFCDALLAAGGICLTVSKRCYAFRRIFSVGERDWHPRSNARSRAPRGSKTPLTARTTYGLTPRWRLSRSRYWLSPENEVHRCYQS